MFKDGSVLSVVTNENLFLVFDKRIKFSDANVFFYAFLTFITIL